MSGLAIGRGKVAGLAAAAVLVSTLSSGAVAQAEPAAAGVPSLCKIRSYAPKTIVIGATPVTRTFSVEVTGCTLYGWATVAWPFVVDEPLSTAGTAGNYWYWDTNADGDAVKVQLKPTISLSPKFLTNASAGKHAGWIEAQAWGEEDPADTVEPTVRSMALTLKRRSTFGSTFNASPEPVKPGDKIRLRATLGRVSWTGGTKLKYVPWADTVSVEFKADGAAKYVHVKRAEANSKGKIDTMVTASTSGRWRLKAIEWTSTAASTSNSDYVKVN